MINRFPLLQPAVAALALALLLCGCDGGREAPLILQRMTIPAGSGEPFTWLHERGEVAMIVLQVPVEGLREANEFGIICDDATWQALSQHQPRAVTVYGNNGAWAREGPDQNAPSFGAAGLDCDKIPNCHYLALLNQVDCPPPHPSPSLTLHLPALLREKSYELVILHSRNQRGLTPMTKWVIPRS